jgi:hypothetical protein
MKKENNMNKITLKQITELSSSELDLEIAQKLGKCGRAERSEDGRWTVYSTCGNPWSTGCSLGHAMYNTSIPEYSTDITAVFELVRTIIDMLNEQLSGYWEFEMGAQHVWLHQHNPGPDAYFGIKRRNARGLAELALLGLCKLEEKDS